MKACGPSRCIERISANTASTSGVWYLPSSELKARSSSRRLKLLLSPPTTTTELMPYRKQNATCIRDTAKAFLIAAKDENGRPVEFWVPKSQVHDESEVYDLGHTGTIVMKDWWAENFDAEKKGWEPY